MFNFFKSSAQEGLQNNLRESKTLEIALEQITKHNSELMKRLDDERKEWISHKNELEAKLIQTSNIDTEVQNQKKLDQFKALNEKFEDTSKANELLLKEINQLKSTAENFHAEKERLASLINEKDLERNRLLIELNDLKNQKATAPNISDEELSRLKDNLKRLELENDSQNKMRININEELFRQRQSNSQATARLADALKENELLFLQLKQLRSDLDSLHAEKINLEDEVDKKDSRLNRFTSKYPQYIDYGHIEVFEDKTASDVPEITFKVKDYYSNALEFNEVLIRILLNNNQPGIQVITDGKKFDSGSDSIFIPSLLAQSSEQKNLFYQFKTNEWNVLNSMCQILSTCMASGWNDLKNRESSDMAFWQSFIRDISQSVARCPILVRVGDIEIKRVLINADYEHLWLKITDLSFGAICKPVFEVRLAASMIKPNEFSRFPKFEFPLINGVTKPFASWFPETSDDLGPKLELRFALDTNSFDFGVWSKISNDDRVLLAQIILLMPDMINKYLVPKTTVSRPWYVWTDLAKDAGLILRAASKITAASDEKRQVNDKLMVEAESVKTSPAAKKKVSVELIKKPSPKKEAELAPVKARKKIASR
jgi:hypothetical protein